MKKIVCVMPIYKRAEITKLVVNYLKKQTMPFFKIILIGSCSEDAETARECRVEYFYCSNDHVGKKYQTGIEKAKKYNPDGVLVTDSDDLLALNYNALCIEKADGYDALGVKVIWIIDKTKTIYQASYKTRIDFFGPGKFFTRRYLDEMDWKIYSTTWHPYCDAPLWSMLMRTKAKTREVGGKILSPKGDWKMVDTWEHIKKAGTFNITTICDSLDKSNEWLDMYFPGTKNEIYALLETGK